MSNLAHQIERKQSEQVSQKIVQKPTPNLRISKGEKTLYFLALLIVVFATYLVISKYANIYMVNAEIHHLNRDIAEQTTVNEGLQLQVTELSAPDRVLHIAQEKLGMTLNDENVKIVQN